MPRLKASKKASVSCFARPAPCQADDFITQSQAAPLRIAVDQVRNQHLRSFHLFVIGGCHCGAQ
jgi:hypothetical protein